MSLTVMPQSPIRPVTYFSGLDKLAIGGEGVRHMTLILLYNLQIFGINPRTIPRRRSEDRPRPVASRVKVQARV